MKARLKIRRAQLTMEFDTDHAADLAKLVPVAQRLAHRAKGAGVTMEAVRREAERRHLITDPRRDRRWSCLSDLPRRAGLVAVGYAWNASGNRVRTYTLPQYATTPARRSA